MTRKINIHSLIQNFYCHKRKNATVPEQLIVRFGLLVYNKPGRATCSSSHTISIINGALSTAKLGLLKL